MNEISSEKPEHGSPRRRRKDRARNKPEKVNVSFPGGVTGGRYAPLNAADLPRMDQAIREILQTIGMADAPDFVIKRVTAAGGNLGDDGRLTFSETLVEKALAGLSGNFTLHGQLPGHELELAGNRVYMGTGGAAPSIRDLNTGLYRDSTLNDLYAVARLVDQFDNIHFFSRPVVARDMPDPYLLDINTAYAALMGTAKHVCTSASHPDHIESIAAMCFTVAGSQDAFVEKPFLSMLINHVVSPLRFHGESCAVMIEAVKRGLPVHANTFGQMGASSPVTIAGCVAQTMAETLAGMILAWLVDPEVKVTCGTRPMITDLRTGAVTGGSGEQALLMAATAQMTEYYHLVNTTIAGATDSKIADAQSGYEKCLTVTLAAHAGSNMITQSCGMQGMLMGCAPESYIIDNDMLGGILRSLSEIEVNDATLAMPSIDNVVHGDGHFLGQSETLNRMQSDFLYPDVADRLTIAEWQNAGARDIRDIAIEKTREILRQHYPRHVSSDIDKVLRTQFDIRLSQSTIRSESS